MKNKLKPYEEYRETAYVWLGNIPKHWQIKRVKTEFFYVKNPSYEHNPVVLSLTQNGIKVRDVSNNEGQLAESYEGYNSVEIGDICLNPMDLESGAARLSNYRGVISNAYFTIRPKYKGRINTKFYSEYFDMHYRLKIFYPYGKGVGRPEGSGGRWTLNRETFMNFPLLLPPKEEQDQIVRYLDSKLSKINKYIKAKKKQIELLKEQKQAIINEEVTKGFNFNVLLKENETECLGFIPENWKLYQLGKAAKIILSGLDKKSYEGQQPVLLCNYVDVYKNEYITHDLTFMKATASDAEINTLKLHKDDVIITKDSESWDDIGVPAYVAEEIENLYCGYHLAILRTNKSILLGEFLYNIFRSQYVQIQHKVKAKGVTRFSLGYQPIHDTILLIPPIEEQKAIIEKLKINCKIQDALIRNLQKEIELILEYRTNLISDVVTGKVDVRNLNDEYIYDEVDTDVFEDYEYDEDESLDSEE